MLKVGRLGYKCLKFGKHFIWETHLISTISPNITPFLSFYYLLVKLTTKNNTPRKPRG